MVKWNRVHGFAPVHQTQEKKMRKPSKKALAVVTAVALLAGGGTAFAYWTTTGTGAGTAATTAGTLNNLTFTQSTVNAMYPGDSSQALTVGVKNTGTESTYVTTVKAYITTDKSGCTGADFKIAGVATGTALAPTGLTWTAADLAANGTADATSTIQFNNTTANQDACKTATVTVHYVAG
jgi:hypothetical protein